MKSDLIKNIARASDALRSHTAGYFNTNVFLTVNDRTAGIAVPYDINDMILLGALTNSDVLLTGRKGAGKTHLSRMAMTALFGQDGFANLNVTPGLAEGDFIDVDIPALRDGRKTKREAMQATPLISRPGSAVQEINRTPEQLQNVLIPYMDRAFTLKGVEFPVGVPLVEGKDGILDPHYQFRIMTMNEGAGYIGTSKMDEAVRDRAALEIPIDIFRPRREDRLQMVRTRSNSDLSVEQLNGGALEEILAVLSESATIQMDKSAEQFLTYLDGLDNCVKSETKSKHGISFKTAMCQGCHFATGISPKGNICGSVYAPSDRSSINLKKIGRMVAALRAYKVLNAVAREELQVKGDSKKFAEGYVANLRVTLDDITAVAPFVLLGTMTLDTAWVNKEFQGSKYLAVKHVVETARDRFAKYVSSPAYEALMNSGGQVTRGTKEQLAQYASTMDPWSYNLAQLADLPAPRNGGRSAALERLLS